MINTKRSVAIIGAGTAGLIAARELGKTGISSIVYDQKTRLGVPVRASGIVSINGLRSIGVDYKKSVTNTLYGARLHAGKSAVFIESKRAVAHVLERRHFNELCREQAEAEGARIVLGERVTPSSLNAIGTDNGVVVGADGAVSVVAKHYNMGELRSYVLTYKAEFDVEVQDKGIVDLFFDKEYNGLFGWLCPNSEGILEAGIGIRPGRHGLNSKKVFEGFLHRKEVAGILSKAKILDGQASIIPMRLRRRIVDAGRRVVLVGDAAGQVKPSTGGGIVFGGNAAILAAKTIHRYFDGEAELWDYESFYKSKYGTDTAIHSVVNRIYSGGWAGGIEFGIKAMRFMGIGSLLGRYGDMDSPTKMLKNMIFRKSGTDA